MNIFQEELYDVPMMPFVRLWMYMRYPFYDPTLKFELFEKMVLENNELITGENFFDPFDLDGLRELYNQRLDELKQITHRHSNFVDHNIQNFIRDNKDFITVLCMNELEIFDQYMGFPNNNSDTKNICYARNSYENSYFTKRNLIAKHRCENLLTDELLNYEDDSRYYHQLHDGLYIIFSIQQDVIINIIETEDALQYYEKHIQKYMDNAYSTYHKFIFSDDLIVNALLRLSK